MISSSRVGQHYKEVNIVDYLSSRFTYRPAKEWTEFVVEGRISVNDLVCDSSTLVTQGDSVACDLPDSPVPPDVNLNYSIIYEDEWLLGVNKPSALLVHDKRRYWQANLIYDIRQNHIPPHPEANLINRLDRNTSGVILLARNNGMLREMQFLFQEKEVNKEYLAVVLGVPEKSKGSISEPIAKLDSLPGVYRFGVDRVNGKTASTSYEVLETFQGKYSLLKLCPQTGRTHQLRVHCHSLGHTILGDKLYSMTDHEYLAWASLEKPEHEELINRQALHCLKTSFKHPRLKDLCVIKADLPEDFKVLFSKLGWENQELLASL